MQESNMRTRIASLVSSAQPDDTVSRVYDYFIIIVSAISLLPLTIKAGSTNDQIKALMNMLDVITVYILFFDYFLRWMSFDKISGKKAPWAFIVYPFTPFAIFDLVSLLPSLGVLGAGWSILRIFRVVKVMQYSKGFTYIINAFKKEKGTLGAVLALALGYILVSALFIFTYEPDTFSDFFEALYWATTSLTTVGYGDLYPVSNVGRLISMISSLFGVAIIALPAGIITASFVEEINLAKESKKKRTKKAKKSGKTPDNEASEKEDGKKAELKSIVDRRIERQQKGGNDED